MSTIMAEKRKRGQNFLAEEKDKLVKLLASHRDTILNKKTDGATNEAKNKAWIEVTNSFNATGNVYRSKDSLMKVWEKLKSESKIYYQNSRRSTMATGGGPSEVKHDPILEQVCSLLGRGCTGIIGVQDCDIIDSEGPYTKKICLDEGKIQVTSERDDIILEVLDQEPVANGDKENEVSSHIMASTSETIPISKTPLWSRRRPQISQINERTEALSSICSSFTNVNKKKEDIEDLKRKLLEEEIDFKRKLYEKQLKLYETQIQAAEKDVLMKDLIIEQIKSGTANWKNLFIPKQKD